MKWLLPARCRLFVLWVLLLAHALSAHAGGLTAVTASLPAAPADRRLHAELAKAKNRPVLINFWATWCEPCREEMPGLQALARRHPELAVITVAVADNKQQVEDFLWEIGVSLPVLHDPAQGLSRPWGARILPTTLILDRRHRIRLRGQGALDWQSPAVAQQLQPLFQPTQERKP